MDTLTELQNTLFQIFQQNMTYLKTHHNELYKKVKLFELRNEEKYFIDFKNNHFELFDDLGKKTYNCDPFYDARCRAESIKTSQAIFNLLIKKIHKKNYNKNDEISAHKLIEPFLIDKKINNKKFIFIGTLLGVHLNDIHRIEKQVSYLICEPSIEIFRLSLFLTDYTELAKDAKLFFAIDFSLKELDYIVEEFLSYEFQYNNHIKFELACEKYLYLIEEFKNIFTSKSPFIDVYSEDILCLKRGSTHLTDQKIPFLKSSFINKKTNKPTLILGAGPSLEKLENFLLQYHQHFFIICASASLKYLQSLNIVPDMIVSIDKKHKEIFNQFEVDSFMYKDSILIFSTKTDLQVIKKVSNDTTFIIEVNYSIISANFYEAVSVGDCMCKLALELGFTNLYLLGIDAAFDKKSNTTHNKYHAQNKKLNSIDQNDDINYEQTYINVKGNFDKEVITNLLYKEIILSFEHMKIPSKCKLFNLSYGAYLNNTQPLSLVQFNNHRTKQINKIELKKEIIKILLQNSYSQISKDTKDRIKKDIQIIKQLQESINQKTFTDIFYNLLKNNKDSITLKILHKYDKLTLPYIFNNKEKEIVILQKKEILEQLLKIFTKILG